MEIQKNQNGSVLCMMIEGRLDTVTAPLLSAELDSSLDGVNELLFDFEKLDYVSSAGLRVLLVSQKKMKEKENGKMVIKNVSASIMDIMKMTGFKDILTIE